LASKNLPQVGSLATRFTVKAIGLLMHLELPSSDFFPGASHTKRIDHMEEATGESGSLGSELRSDARTIKESASQRLHREVDARKGGAVDQAKAVSSVLDRAAEELGQHGPSWLQSAVKSVSRSVHELAETVEGKDSQALTRDVQRIAREHPGSFLAACAFAGFAAARVMQAGSRSGGHENERKMGGSGAASPLDQPAIGLRAGTEAYATPPSYGGAAL
jgi:hypothetical protein